ncbi:hypothetical protein KUM42_19960 [Modestobacter sp. L9-4]|uniref:hypothetical protein n=1 Tax=Modestobacter sp. L9-4 TaxID=2851567 RepID=UPI001C76A597|nr:hypothetical protein [Modestobacter sp. L9-4]QXG76006.1 hypothetical protein KUM42_19960 [Modestobacter sp. L9-4]
MLADRELDALLDAGAAVRDVDLPPLPEDFLHVLQTSDRDDAPASVLAARQLVSDAHEARTTPRRRRPSRRVAVRAGAAVLALAAAWTTAVVIAPEEGRAPEVPTAQPPVVEAPVPAPLPTPAEPIDPPGGLSLVAAEAVTFPWSLDPAPVGLAVQLTQVGGPTPFGEQPPGWIAEYRSADEPGFTFTVSQTDPRDLGPGNGSSPPTGVVESRTVTVAGTPADARRIVRDAPDCEPVPGRLDRTEPPAQVCSDTLAELVWHRPDGRWLQVWGEGDTYGRVDAVVAVAQSVVERPQPVAVQVGLAPEGWTVASYESGSNLTLVDDATPSFRNQVNVSMWGRWDTDHTVPGYLQYLAQGEPVEAVTVQGRPAELASVPDPLTGPGFPDEPEPARTWYVMGQVPGGPVFLLQAPDTLSREDVLAVAEQVTYEP